MKRLCIALAGLLVMAAPAAAADLGQPSYPYYKAPPAPLPVYSWTGFYLGVNGGGGFGRSAWDSAGGFDISGGLVGGTVGYNYQIGRAVIGVEGDIDWADINGTNTSVCAAGCKTSDSWLSTVRGRVGYSVDRFLPYITGGAAFGDIRASSPGLAGNSATNAGWTIGAGIEGVIAGPWTAKLEYLYVDLGNFNCGLGCGPAIDNVSFHTNLLRAGVNYRF